MSSVFRDEFGNERWRGTLSGGGGSQPEIVRLAFAFDTPGLALPVFPIDAASTAGHTITVAAQSQPALVSYFPPGQTFAVTESTGNDGTYTVVSATYNVGTGDIDVVVAEAVPDETADGKASIPGPVGIKFCDLAAGDIIAGAPVSTLNVLSVAEAWDTGAALSATTTAGRGNLPATPPEFWLNGSIDVANFDAFPAFPGVLFVQQTGLDPGGAVIVAADTELWLWIDNSGQFPYSATGQAELTVSIIRAAP